MKRVIAVCCAAIVGFLLGTMWERQTAVKAQSNLQVYIAHREATNMSLGSLDIPGRQIVGFSCVLDKEGIYTECYTAYTK